MRQDGMFDVVLLGNMIYAVFQTSEKLNDRI